MQEKEITEEIVEKISSLIKEGKSVDEIVLTLNRELKKCEFCNEVKLDVKNRSAELRVCDSCW